MGLLTHHPAVPMNSLWKNGHLEVPLPWSLHIKHCLTHPDSSRSSSHTNPFTHPLINCPIIIPNIYPMIFPSSSHHDPMVFSYIYIFIQWVFSIIIPCLSHIWPIFNSHFCPRCSPTAPRQSSGPGCREGRRRDQSRGDRARYGQRAAARGGMQNSVGKSWAYNWLLYIWLNYNDLTATSLESWLVREIIPKWPYFRLVKYYNLPRYIYIYTHMIIYGIIME